MKKTRIKLDAAEHDVPQTMTETVAAIAEIGRAQRERDRIQTDMNERLAAVREEYEAAAKPHAERIAVLTQGVATWCEAHRGELTIDGKTKTARLASGEVSWRTRPPSIVPRRGALDRILAALRAAGLDRFIRVREELDKEAILAEPSAIADFCDIAISQKEDFVIKPFDTELEEVR